MVVCNDVSVYLVNINIALLFATLYVLGALNSTEAGEGMQLCSAQHLLS